MYYGVASPRGTAETGLAINLSYVCIEVQAVLITLHNAYDRYLYMYDK